MAEDVLAHEAELLLLLHQLVNAAAVPDGDGPLQVAEEMVEPLARVRVADAIGKARAHQVMSRIRARLDAGGTVATAWPYEVGFSRGQVLLSAFWKTSDTVYTGWQYQGRQWRLAMVLTNPTIAGKTAGQREARAAYARQHLDFFNFEPMYKLLGCTEQDCLPPRGRTGPTDFNHYAPQFVYQYRLLPEVTVSQFVDLAVSYSHTIAQWRPS